MKQQRNIKRMKHRYRLLPGKARRVIERNFFRRFLQATQHAEPPLLISPSPAAKGRDMQAGRDLRAEINSIIVNQVSITITNGVVTTHPQDSFNKIIKLLHSRGLLSPEFAEELEQEKFRYFVD
jgi:hypothetical protein